jgi:hypothetical protein
MSLAKQQSLLARLYTNADLLAEFLDAPVKVALENGLSEIESQQLATIVPRELQSFAQSLFYKRLREVEKLLPLSAKVLDKKFSELFHSFSDEFPPQTIKKHFADAVAFAAFLQKNERVSPWISDLIQFELAKLEFNGNAKFFVLCIFQHDIRDILNIVQRHNHLDAINKLFGLRERRTFAVWLRVGKSGASNHFVW